MHWILAAILILRTLMPSGLGAVASPFLDPSLPDSCGSASVPSESASTGCPCCEVGSCACEMAPSPAIPSRTPEPASPNGSSSVRPVLLSIEPTTTMIVGWINDHPPAIAPAASLPVHATLGESVQAAHCVWRN